MTQKRAHRWWPLVAVPLLFVAVVVGVYALSGLLRANELVRHTDDVRVALGRLLATLVDAETGVRGYAVAGETVFLQPYERAEAEWHEELEQVRALTRDNAAQQERVARLEQLEGERLQFLAALKAERDAGKSGAELTPAMMEGKRVMDEVRSTIAEMRAEEDRLDRLQVSEAIARWRWSIGLFVGATFGLTTLLLAIWLQRRAAEARRERAEEVARASELFGIVLEGADVGITVQEPAGRLVYANSAAAQILGFPSGEALLAQPAAAMADRFEAFHLDGTPFPLDQFPGRTALEGRHGEEVSLRFRRRGSAEDRWSRVRAVPALDPAGKVVYAINFFREVTAEVIEKERRAFLLRAADELAATLDLEQTAATVTRLAIPILGDACAIDLVEESARRRVGYIGTPDLLPALPEVLPGAPTVDGERSHLSVPLRARGQILGVLSFARAASGRRYDERDLELGQRLADRAALAIDNARLLRQTETARLQATAERDRSDVSFHRMVDAVKDYAIFMLDDEGIVASWNRGAQLIKGYRADEIIGRHFSTFYPLEDVLAGKCDRELKVARREGRFEEEGWRVRKDGSLFWANVVITAVTDERGEVKAFTKVTRDLTERRRAQERLVEEEKKRVGAETHSRFAETFIGILGHDLRNPLNAIAMSAQLMKRRAEGGSGAVDRILSSSERMSHMVVQLLDLTRMRFGGGLALDKHETDLGEVVVAVVDELRLVHPGREVDLRIEAEARGVWDRGRLEQAVSNLVGNALEHGEAGLPVTVRLSLTDDEAVLRVHNLGPPIPAETLPALFDPYKRIEKRGPRAKGLGLGLFITRQIVEAHGGQIGCRSEAETGTTFTISLPLSLDERRSPPPHAQV